MTFYYFLFKCQAFSFLFCFWIFSIKSFRLFKYCFTMRFVSFLSLGFFDLTLLSLSFNGYGLQELRIPWLLRKVTVLLCPLFPLPLHCPAHWVFCAPTREPLLSAATRLQPGLLCFHALLAGMLFHPSALSSGPRWPEEPSLLLLLEQWSLIIFLI